MGYIIKFILIIVPIMIIVMGTIDLIKNIINPDNNDKLKLFIKRLIAGVSIFFVTSVVLFIFNLLDNNIENNYIKCFLNPNLCNKIISNSKNNETNCKFVDDNNECCKFILNNKKASYSEIVEDCVIPISTFIGG